MGRVLHLRLNSPKNLNALSSTMIEALLERLKPEEVCKASVVLLTGAGRHFGAGHDLAEMTGAAYDPSLFWNCSKLMERVATCEVPTVAAVQGCAYAAGCQLAASCDIVLAAHGAKFATPGTNIGLFCSTPSVAVTRAATAKVAADMLFSAREVSAEEAVQCGLASRVVSPSSSVEEEALRTCHHIAETPREVLVGGKALLLQQRGQGLNKAYELASEAMARGMASEASKEGIAAFLKKRRPLWPSEEAEVAEVLALLPQGVAMVGASPDPTRPSNKVLASLQQASVPVQAINPKVSASGGTPHILGAPCYASLEEVPGSIVVVDVFRASGAPAAEVVEEAITLAQRGRGVRAVWLQEGVRAPEAEARARAAGLLVVADKCIKVELHRAREQRTPVAKL